MKIVRGLIATACLLLAGTSFAADTGLRGYNLQFFEPAVDGSGVISAYGSGTLGHLKPHLGFYLNVSRGLLTAGNLVNKNQIDIVDTFLTGDFLFGLGLFDWLDVGLDVPVFFFERGRDFKSAQIFDTSGIGDIRLDLKFRLLKDEGKKPGVALLSSLYLPSGETSKFTGSKNVEWKGSLIVDKKFKHLYMSGNVGYRAVEKQNVVGVDYDDQLTFGAGVKVPLPIWNRSVEVLGEIYGSTVLGDSREITTPVEALGGLRKNFNNGLSLTFAGGGGITSASGAPEYRIVAGVAYTFGIAGGGVGKSSPRFDISEKIYYGFDQFTATPEYIALLDRVVKRMNEEKRATIVISGHADSTGPREYNEKLSEKRAFGVKEYLIMKGVAVGRLIVRFFGESEPAESNATKQGRAKNRRVEITAASEDQRQ